MEKMTVKINDLSFKCIIGILPKERIKKQRVIINLSFKYTFKENEFVDYSKVAKDIEVAMKKEKFQLIEDAILYLKSRLSTRYPIKNIKLSITKPDILKNCSVCVSS